MSCSLVFYLYGKVVAFYGEYSSSTSFSSQSSQIMKFGFSLCDYLLLLFALNIINFYCRSSTLFCCPVLLFEVWTFSFLCFVLNRCFSPSFIFGFVENEIEVLLLLMYLVGNESYLECQFWRMIYFLGLTAEGFLLSPKVFHNFFKYFYMGRV